MVWEEKGKGVEVNEEEGEGDLEGMAGRGVTKAKILSGSMYNHTS